MLQRSGIYSIKNEHIEIRLPNPDDITFKWSNADEEFKEQFITFWFETSVLSQKKTDKQVYNISMFAYRQLILLDHVGYMLNHNLIKKDFVSTIQDINATYAKPLSILTTGLSTGG